MPDAVIFKALPATFPEEDKNKKPAAVSSIVVHIVLLTGLVLVPLLMPQRIENWQLLTMIAPLSPPPAPAPAPVPPAELEATPKPAVPDIQPVIQVDPSAIVTPTEIPREIARIVDEAPIAGVDGIPHGVSNTNMSGVLRAVLLTTVKTSEVAPPPPPPPPPPPAPSVTALVPVRVGGNIREPKAISLVPPVYPVLAKKARVQGTVIMEATVTAEGTVDEIHVMSGNPLLIQAAIDCLKQWRYEPTYLNGEPVPVILTAKINFELRGL
jgi:protein TonB